ncbi:hypothetical protein HanXRQr2_Chr09g0389821 [Helianthus annuus]|uniref:Uncharacterized protein n=1 Tax=Helianthus annuus TaxID=4232 RepID=A0A251TVS5_HELAN|nr:hypothetical protein HanXRQr2_Chr09g0389821 [Helianthus annuus]
MASGDYTPPPSFSSGNFISMEPQFSASYLPADGQLTVASEPYVPGPSLSGYQHGSGNSITGADVDRWLGQTGYGAPAPDLDATGHVNTSEIGLNHDSGYVAGPSQSAMVHQNQSKPGDVSTAYDPLNNVQHSIPGRHFPRGNLTGPYYL